MHRVMAAITKRGQIARNIGNWMRLLACNARERIAWPNMMGHQFVITVAGLATALTGKVIAFPYLFSQFTPFTGQIKGCRHKESVLSRSHESVIASSGTKAPSRFEYMVFNRPKRFAAMSAKYLHSSTAPRRMSMSYLVFPVARSRTVFIPCFSWNKTGMAIGALNVNEILSRLTRYFLTTFLATRPTFPKGMRPFIWSAMIRLLANLANANFIGWCRANLSNSYHLGDFFPWQKSTRSIGWLQKSPNHAAAYRTGNWKSYSIRTFIATYCVIWQMYYSTFGLE